MYKYTNEANRMINQYLEFSNLKDDYKTFFKFRINKFFEEYMSLNDRPIDAITYHDVNNFIESINYSNYEKLNYYNVLKYFFTFAYLKDLIPKEILKGVIKPQVTKKKIEYIDEISIGKMIAFIHDSSNSINERLVLGFFLFTGLSRKYIANIQNGQISLRTKYKTIHFNVNNNTKNDDDNTEIEDDNDTKIMFVPLKKELVELIDEFWRHFAMVKPYEKVFSINQNQMSNVIKRISKTITGKGFTPTHFSNTFIRYALARGNDVLSVSNLTLESVNTIMKHVNVSEEDLLNNQMNILKSLYNKRK